MHSTAVFQAVVLLVGLQTCLARNIMPLVHKSVDAVPAADAELPQLTITDSGNADRTMSRWFNVARQAKLNQIKAAYEDRVDDSEAQTHAPFTISPRAINTSFESTSSERDLAFNQDTTSERFNGSSTLDSLRELMKNMTKPQLRQGIVQIRYLLEDLEFERIRGTNNQLYKNTRSNDYTKDCVHKISKRNNIFFYTPIYQDLFPEWRESFLFYVKTPWAMTYHSKLRSRLEANGFVTVQLHSMCERWLRETQVTKGGVTRGIVDYKLPEGYIWNMDSNGQLDEQFELIKDILEHTYPVAEILVVVLGSLLTAIVLFVLGSWISMKKWWDFSLRRWYQRSKTANRIDSDCVELRGSSTICKKCNTVTRAVEEF